MSFINLSKTLSIYISIFGDHQGKLLPQLTEIYNCQPVFQTCGHCQLRQFKTNISKVFTILHKFLGIPWGPIGQDSLPNSKKIKMQKACKRNVCRLFIGGAAGIRTLVPVKANGFQDRLVMTASIQLHLKALNYTYIRTSLQAPLILCVYQLQRNSINLSRSILSL